ncbi:GDSL esterase/lipase 1-like [Lycium ferocissimum]|uniref:GDSL esterase/lipase 1-like n=1 Tax=Lycium ferocissimum TaxID=112874 RepID=UPI002816630A|nr:GDSL esterase/lipase 1-like [Lycium ferocissimum]
MRKVESSGSYFALLLLLLVVSHTGATAAAGLFIFGDSTVDAGNNNYIQTIPENRANFKPYAQNGFFHEPTGRFSDGRIIVDFIAEYAKLPLIPPYLQPNADFSNGVNFASGGAGVLSTTHPGLVIDLERQLKHFEEVRKSLTEKMGAAKAEELVSEAVYFISIGSNDYMGGYFGNEMMQQLHGPEEYLGMVVGNLTQAIQELYEKGARKFGFLSLSPLGCLPALRALNPNEAVGGCFQAASDLALAHNNALTIVLTSLQHILQGFNYCNSNFYDWLLQRVNNPSKYGFKEGMNACCGAGPYGGINACGGTKKATDYHLCDNAKDYIWFDSFHPTEGIHEQFAKALWDGPSSSVGPYTLQNLFFSKEKQTIADLVDI